MKVDTAAACRGKRSLAVRAWKERRVIEVYHHTPIALDCHPVGPFEVRLHGASLPRLRSRKVQWLLALLTLRHGADVERPWLAGLLWPEAPESQALASLRSSLTDLRRALGPEAERLHSPSLHTLSLDLSRAQVDVVAFDQAMARGDPPALEQAIALYRGPLLEGCAEEWAFQERQAYLPADAATAHPTAGCGSGSRRARGHQTPQPPCCPRNPAPILCPSGWDPVSAGPTGSLADTG
jgi:two-component SAPR family response regulator